MAKIGNLQVDTINLDYISTSAVGTGSVVSTNPKANPVQIFWALSVLVYVPSPGGIPTSATVNIIVRRTDNSKTFYQRQQFYSGGSISTFSFQINGAALDWSAGSNISYTFATSSGGSGGTVTYSNKSITAMWCEI